MEALETKPTTTTNSVKICDGSTNRHMAIRRIQGGVFSGHQNRWNKTRPPVDPYDTLEEILCINPSCPSAKTEPAACRPHHIPEHEMKHISTSEYTSVQSLNFTIYITTAGFLRGSTADVCMYFVYNLPHTPRLDGCTSRPTTLPPRTPYHSTSP